MGAFLWGILQVTLCPIQAPETCLNGSERAVHNLMCRCVGQVIAVVSRGLRTLHWSHQPLLWRITVVTWRPERENTLTFSHVNNTIEFFGNVKKKSHYGSYLKANLRHCLALQTALPHWTA